MWICLLLIDSSRKLSFTLDWISNRFNLFVLWSRFNKWICCSFLSDHSKANSGWSCQRHHGCCFYANFLILSFVSRISLLWPILTLTSLLKQHNICCPVQIVRGRIPLVLMIPHLSFLEWPLSLNPRKENWGECSEVGQISQARQLTRTRHNLRILQGVFLLSHHTECER